MARPQLTFDTVTFTPQMASDMLDKHANEKNRTLRQRKVERFADDMRKKKWDVNGEPLIIGSDNTVLDGHHRLWACVLADAAFTTAVTRGVDPTCFKSIDTGTGRTAADVIHISGQKKYQRQIATACSLAMQYEQGKHIARKQHSPREVSDYYDAHQDIDSWVEAASKGDMRPFAAPIAAVVYLASTKYRQRAVEFVERLIDGADLPKGSPVLALRNRLMASGNVGKDTSVDRFALITLGWNAYIDTRQLTRMQIFKGDRLPKIKGATA